MNGLFIVFEGIDGSGKTTQINLLSEWLVKNKLIPKDSSLKITREPGGTQLGLSLREILLLPSVKASPHPISELLLYAADRVQHIEEIIKPSLKNGDWIISDRFDGSTRAYQGYGRGLDLNLIKTLEAITSKEIKPNITFFLDIPVELSLERRKNQSNDRMESEGKEFLKKVIKGFEEISLEKNWIKIDAQKNTSEVFKDIQDQILKLV